MWNTAVFATTNLKSSCNSCKYNVINVDKSIAYNVLNNINKLERDLIDSIATKKKTTTYQYV